MLELWLQLSFLVDFYQGIIKMQMTPSASLQNFYTILFLGFVVPNAALFGAPLLTPRDANLF